MFQEVPAPASPLALDVTVQSGLVTKAGRFMSSRPCGAATSFHLPLCVGNSIRSARRPVLESWSQSGQPDCASAQSPHWPWCPSQRGASALPNTPRSQCGGLGSCTQASCSNANRNIPQALGPQPLPTGPHSGSCLSCLRWDCPGHELLPQTTFIRPLLALVDSAPCQARGPLTPVVLPLCMAQAPGKCTPAASQPSEGPSRACRSCSLSWLSPT